MWTCNCYCHRGGTWWDNLRLIRMHGCCFQTRQQTWRFGLSAQAFASSPTDIQLKRFKRGQCLNKQSSVFAYLSCQLQLATTQKSKKNALLVSPFTHHHPAGAQSLQYTSNPESHIVRAKNGFGKEYKHPTIFKPQQGMRSSLQCS